MKVLLRDDVAGVGRRGGIVKVAGGFARDFLLPEGRAIVATDGVEGQAEQMRRGRDLREAKDRGAAESQATILAGAVIPLAARAGGGGRRFGAIGPADVGEAIRARAALRNGNGSQALSAAFPGAELLTRLSAKLFDTAQNATLLADVPLAGDHGAQLVDLLPADYDLVVTGTATGYLSAQVGYRVDLLLDPKCDAATTPPYQESGDDNDALSVDFAQTPAVASIGASATPISLRRSSGPAGAPASHGRTRRATSSTSTSRWTGWRSSSMPLSDSRRKSRKRSSGSGCGPAISHGLCRTRPTPES